MWSIRSQEVHKSRKVFELMICSRVFQFEYTNEKQLDLQVFAVADTKRKARML